MKINCLYEKEMNRYFYKKTKGLDADFPCKMCFYNESENGVFRCCFRDKRINKEVHEVENERQR